MERENSFSNTLKDNREIICNNSWCQYQDWTQDTLSNIALRLQTPSRYGLYLTVYPLSRPYTDTVTNPYGMFVLTLFQRASSIGRLEKNKHFMSWIRIPPHLFAFKHAAKALLQDFLFSDAASNWGFFYCLCRMWEHH